MSLFWAAFLLGAARLTSVGLWPAPVLLLAVWCWVALPYLLLQVALVVDAGAVLMVRRTVIIGPVARWVGHGLAEYSKRAGADNPPSHAAPRRSRRKRWSALLSFHAASVSPLGPLSTWALAILMRSPYGVWKDLLDLIELLLPQIATWTGQDEASIRAELQFHRHSLWDPDAFEESPPLRATRAFLAGLQWPPRIEALLVDQVRPHTRWRPNPL